MPNVTAAEVIVAELEQVCRRRRQLLMALSHRPAENRAAGPELLEERPAPPFGPGDDADARLRKAWLEALRTHAVGLSFSGGGIRSATFAVGFLQGLAQLQLLGRIDYLSTVSGGGYAGAWLVAWLKRAEDIPDITAHHLLEQGGMPPHRRLGGQGVQEVETQLDPSRIRQAGADRVFLGSETVVEEEPEPLFHLREYSSYLAPRFGLLTADTWTIVAIWLRNVSINMLVLLPMAMMLVLLARMVVSLFDTLAPSSLAIDPLPVWIPWSSFALGSLLFFWGFFNNARALGEFRADDHQRPGTREGRLGKRPAFIETRVYSRIVYPMVAASVLLTLPLREIMGQIGTRLQGFTGGERWTSNPLINGLSDFVSGDLGLLGLPNLAGHALVLGGLLAIVACLRYHKSWTLVGLLTIAAAAAGGGALLAPSSESLAWPVKFALLFVVLLALATIGLLIVCGLLGVNRKLGTYVGAALMSGATGGVLLAVLESITRSLQDGQRVALTATIVPALALSIYVASMVVEVALLGRNANEGEREWWARLSALLLIAAISWLATMAAILYVPALFLWAGPVLRTALATGWLGTTIFGLLAGRRASAGGPASQGGSSLAQVAALVPPVFLVGLLGAVSLGVSYLVNMPPPAFPAPGDDWTATGRYALGVAGTSFWSLLPLFIGSAVVYMIGNRTIDVNLFSLHAMYANRLIRCYLGASRPKPRWEARWGGMHSPHMGGGAPALGGAPPPAPAPPPPDGDQRSLDDLDLAALRALRRALERETDDLKARLRALNRERTSNPGRIALIDPEIATTSRDLYWKTCRLLDALDLLATREDRAYRAGIELERRRRAFDVVRWRVGPIPRDENPVTGFDPLDDIPLYDLQIGIVTDRTPGYWGPFLLINTAVNLVAGRELAYRDRKSESFVLTPLHCGAKGVGYAPVTTATKENLTLGRAITISGAAVDPNMSFYQSPALTALLTIFNARLGYWMQNPRFAGWSAEAPRFGDRLAAELLGQTSERDDYVHLSDGGHFENLGIYELVRRRCRYIVAVDAGEDADASNDNLANLVRLCRIDFGIRVELDTEPLQASGPDRLSRTHVVVGRVHYEDLDNGQVPGIIVYIKISLTGDEPSDVQKYARTDPRFPHQPTDLRQSFHEDQFESYRALGDHIARDVFGDAVGKLRDSDTRDGSAEWSKPATQDAYVRGNQRFFSAVRGRWSSPPADHDERFTTSSRDWSRLQRQLRTDPDLAELGCDLYPELTPDVAPSADVPDARRRRVELHAVGQMLQVMEDAWIRLGLKGHYDLPMDRGWMNAFRRWTATRAFHRSWPILRPEFSPDFVDFCEDQLHLGSARTPWHILCPNTFNPDDPNPGDFEGRSVLRLNEEFRREWPDEAWPSGRRAASGPRDLVAMIRRAQGFQLTLEDPPGNHAPIWLIVQAPSGEKTAGGSDERFACGLILLCPYQTIGEGGLVDEPDTLELFVWIRRAHRSTGLGSRCLRPLVQQIGQKLPRGMTVKVRYPKSGQAAEQDLELAMWKSFFSLYDFKPVKLPEDANETILWRHVGPINPARPEEASPCS